MIKKFEDLKGEVITKITASVDDDEVVITTNKGVKVKLYYEED